MNLGLTGSAAPVTRVLMHQWLQGYPVRIDFHPAVLGLAVVSAALIAILAVGFQTLRAAKANPVNSLRPE